MKTRKILTLCIIHQENKVLLGMKKRGFGAGRWNGFGGKVEQGETIDQAAKRELQEEVGLEAGDLTEHGVLDFEFENDEKILEVHIFRITKFTGDPVETEEMKPEWFNIENIPYEQMWTDDIYWVPILLERKKFKGRLLFDKPSTADYSAKILEKDIQVLS